MIKVNKERVDAIEHTVICSCGGKVECVGHGGNTRTKEEWYNYECMECHTKKRYKQEYPILVKTKPFKIPFNTILK